MPYAYCTLESLKVRLTDSGYANDTNYRSALEAAARWIDHVCGRQFQPYTATRTFTATDHYRLQVPDLLTVTSLKTDKTTDRTYADTWATTDYDLWPFDAPDDERPYREIRTTPEGDYTFPSFSRGVQIIGTWGFWQSLATATTAAEAIDASETAIDVTSGAAFERLQTILIDSEQMYVTAVNGNTITVVRGVNGTTAATHSNGATISRYEYPAAVVEVAALVAARTTRRRDAVFGTVGGSDIGEIRIPSQDPDVLNLLRPYRRVPTFGGA